jgi:PAS domain S-box-containing protein
LIAAAVFGVIASAAIFAVMQRLERLRAEGLFLQAEQRLSVVRTGTVDPLDTICVLASHFEAVGDGGTSRGAFSTLVARRLALADGAEGFSSNPERFAAMLQARDRRLVSPLVSLHLLDLSRAESGRQLYPRNPVTTPELLTGGLLATPEAGFSSRPYSLGSLLVLVFGLMLTGVYLRYVKAKAAQSAEIAGAAHEIQRAEAELQQTNEMLEAVIHSSPLAVVVLDLEGKVTLWNPAAERMQGWTKEEVLGGYLPIILPQSNPDEVQRVHERILSKGHVTGLEYLCTTKSGSHIKVSVSGAPLHNAAGELSGAVYLVMEITEQKRLESQLGQAQKLESIGQLAAGIAHEINTPIQYVGDNLRFLQESFESRNRLYAAYQCLVMAVQNGQPADGLAAECEAIALEVDVDYLREEIPRALEQSLEGTEHVAQIVGAMKEFSHFGTVGKISVDINHAIRSTTLVSRHEWKYVADLKTDFDEDLPKVQCIPGELNQVILNLIINAAHAIGDVVGRQPGAKGTITISTRRDGDWAEIRVSDTGTGIPEAARPNIFNPFFTTKGVGKGTGQGLAIAHSVVVQRHGGSITFETDMGVGTTFLVRLPLGGANEAHSVRG